MNDENIDRPYAHLQLAGAEMSGKVEPFTNASFVNDHGKNIPNGARKRNKQRTGQTNNR